jgi:hypothetical protein
LGCAVSDDIELSSSETAIIVGIFKDRAEPLPDKGPQSKQSEAQKAASSARVYRF